MTSEQKDIVTQLRAVLHNDRSVELVARDAADEIERLRADREKCHDIMESQSHQLARMARENERLRAELVSKADELQKQYRWHHLLTEAFAAEKEATIRDLRKVEAERDEARRMVCGLDADIMEDQIEYAKHRGWDCFKDDKQ